MLFTNLTRRIEIGANCYSIELGGKRIVLDCGMHPEQEGDEALPNFSLLPDDSVDAIILSHAHHDHLGALPLLMRRQPRAAVFMSEATRFLAEVMLHNSVNVMTRQREELGTQNYPLFTHREVDLCVKRWRPIPLRQRFSAEGERTQDDGELTFEFHDAGHVLGAVGTLMRIGGRTLFYSGDVNFNDQTISRAARFPEEKIDVLIMETTRGDHATAPGFTREAEQARLARSFKQAFERGGAVLMPLFALGKTQELLAMLHDLKKTGQLANVPIYIGGLSTKLTELYDKLARSSARLKPELQILDAVAPFVIAGRASGDEPIRKGRIYALSAGMMTEKTLSNSFARRMMSDPAHSIFFVGYADPKSPGGKLRLAAPGDMIALDSKVRAQPLRATVERFDFSGHASRESIRDYVKKLAPKKVILVHGELPAVEWFQNALAADLPQSEVIAPTPGLPIEL
ncbi:MAG: cleavage and polyadenylation specificity factor subunit 3 [Chthoniobacter sp.]|jgi:Cft2 family RNA processing exonuclease|nr:cleavage and polyadenylation specificity factor subunit 3 [Chthoniobacter sp.]